MDAVDRGVSVRLPEPGIKYHAFVDMSGGSSDDATLGIAHRDTEGRAILDRVMDQGQRPPFDPRKAVERFVVALKEYGLKSVTRHFVSRQCRGVECSSSNYTSPSTV